MTTMRPGDENRAWRRLAVVALCLGSPLVALGLFAALEGRQAAPVVAKLDHRIQSLRREVAEGTEADQRRDELSSDIRRLEMERTRALRVLPCEKDLPALEEDLRARLEPLGVVVRAAPTRVRKKEFYDEACVPIELPARDAVETEVIAALRSSERLIQLGLMSENPPAPCIVAFVWRCDRNDPWLSSYDEPIPGRELITWPFARAVETREDEVRRLRAERRRHADALLLSHVRRNLAADLERRKLVVEELVKRDGPPR